MSEIYIYYICLYETQLGKLFLHYNHTLLHVFIIQSVDSFVDSLMLFLSVAPQYVWGCHKVLSLT